MEDQARVVRVQAPTFARIKRLQAELAERTGLPVRQGDVVGRAVQALEDAHAGSAWLSPAESSVAFERRHREQVASVAAQIIARLRPDLSLARVEFDASSESLVLMFHEEHPAISAHVAGLLGPSSADRKIVA